MKLRNEQLLICCCWFVLPIMLLLRFERPLRLCLL
jgi:hypothetical protein